MGRRPTRQWLDNVAVDRHVGARFGEHVDDGLPNARAHPPIALSLTLFMGAQVAIDVMPAVVVGKTELVRVQ